VYFKTYPTLQKLLTKYKCFKHYERHELVIIPISLPIVKNARNNAAVINTAVK